MDWHLDRLLKLPNMTVVKVQEIEGLIFLSLESLKEGIICPRCGNYTEDVHQTREVLVRDLSICTVPKSSSSIALPFFDGFSVSKISFGLMRIASSIILYC